MRGSQSTFSTLPEVKVKVKRSEFEDATLRSLDREGNRLSHVLRNVDRARKVVKKELERDERCETAKFLQKLNPVHLVQHLPLESARSSDVNEYSSNNSGGFGGATVRSKTTLFPLASRPCTHSGRRRISCDFKTEGVSNGVHSARLYETDFDCDESHRSSEVPRWPTRTDLFDNLSKPKNRSEVLSVRNRLRQEFESARPETTHRINFTVRKPSGMRKYCSPLGTPRKASLAQLSQANKRIKREESVRVLTSEEIQTFLHGPAPVIVKRKQ